MHNHAIPSTIFQTEGLATARNSAVLGDLELDIIGAIASVVCHVIISDNNEFGMSLKLEGRYGARDEETGALYEWSSLVCALPWRSNQVMPHEPRMPPHQYVLRDWCEGEQRKLYEALRFIIDTHAESYRGYFRAYKSPMRYLEVGTGPGDFRYWGTVNKTAGGTKHFLNRCRLDSVEPPRRVDQGARPIPLRDWGASQPYWPRDSGYGE